MTAGGWEKKLSLGLFVCCVLTNLILSAVGWSHSLREVHEFRQTQTALAARFIQKDGWTLAGPLPLFGPPWSAPMEFPLYQTCVAKISTWTGLPLESTGRFVSLIFFYLSLPAFFLLLRQLAIPPDRRWLFLALLLITPLYLYYSRSFMIESAALCAAAWFLQSYARAIETRRPAWIFGAIVLGSLAGLIKATTFAIFLIPAIILTLRPTSRSGRPPETMLRSFLKTAAVGLAIALPSLVLAFAWVGYGDAVKNSNPLSRFLSSSQLHTWNYGTLAQRLDGSFWRTLWETSSTSVLQIVGMVLFAIVAAISKGSARLHAAALLVCFVAGPLLFSNLYFLHDYYFYATGIFLLGAVMVGWNELLDRTSIPVAVRWLAILSTFAAQIWGFTHTYFRVQARGDLESPELARVLGQITNPGDVLLLHGFAWNPAIPYVSDRKAIMVTDESARHPQELDDVLNRLPGDSVGAWAIAGEHRDDPAFIKPLVEKLHLQPSPILRNDQVVVFLANRLIPTALPRLERMRLSTFTLDTPPDAEINGVKLRRYRVSDLPDPKELDMFTPRPSQILAPFGLSTAMVNDVRVLNAHAPTEVTVPLSAGRRRLKADYGLLPGAYAGEKKTDGVIFQVELMAGNAPPTVLFEKTLNPATQADDRGPHHLELQLPAGAVGDVVFKTLPGPHNDLSFDWAYWTSVEIK